MKARKVSELMIPISDYATVSQDGSLADAIKSLKAAQSDTKFHHKHRAVLAFDQNNIVVGKLGIREILMKPVLMRDLSEKINEVLN